MKYEFIKVDEDNIKLKYKDKEFNFRKNVELIKELQSLNVKARKKMIVDLAKEGVSTKDLTIKKEENGKIFYDNSNMKSLEEMYIGEITIETFDKICKKYCNMSYGELIEDINLDNENKIVEFSKDFAMNISGKEKTPSK